VIQLARNGLAVSVSSIFTCSTSSSLPEEGLSHKQQSLQRKHRWHK
jgi:hypothetical protein